MELGRHLDILATVSQTGLPRANLVYVHATTKPPPSPHPPRVVPPRQICRVRGRPVKGSAVLRV